MTAWAALGAALVAALPTGAAAAPAEEGRAADSAGAAPHGARGRAREPHDPEDDWIFQNRQPQVRHQALLIDTGVWVDRVVAGLWYNLPLAHNGILPGLNDAIILDLGLDYTWLYDNRQSTHGLWIAVGPRWDFYLTRSWMTYASFHLGLFTTLQTRGAGARNPNFFQPGVGVGGMYTLTDAVRLALDLGYPQGLRVGLDFNLDGGG